MFNHKLTISLLALSSSLLIKGTASAHAELLAYEGFAYAAAQSLVGSNGGLGWNGAWQNIAGTGGTTLSGSLKMETNAPSGFDLRSSGNAAFINTYNRSGRFLDCSSSGPFGTRGFLNGNNCIGADGKTLFISFTQQPNKTIKFYEFEFHRDNLGDPGRIAGIGNDYNSTTVNFRAPNSKQTPVGPGSTNICLYILKIDFKAGNDDVYVYRNPVGSTEGQNEPVLTMLSVSDMSFDGISLAAFENGTTVKHDEIRIGETWSDVLGGAPEFVLQPGIHRGFMGEAVTLSALAQSKQPVNYQWYTTKGPLSGETQESLLFPSLKASDAGSYWVLASNSLGVATSSIASLCVEPIQLSTWSKSLKTGTNFSLQTTVKGAEPMLLQWFKDDQLLSGETNQILTRLQSTVFDSGTYFLVASNAYGVVTSATMTVHANIGGLLAYEGFDYAAASANASGQNGGLGWNGPWSTIGGTSGSIINPSLAISTNVFCTFDFHSVGNAHFQPNGSRSGRLLDCSETGLLGLHGLIDEHGNVGADNTTLYISFLQQPDGTSKFYEFEFHRSDLGDAGRIAGIGNDKDSTMVNFRAPDGTQTAIAQGTTNVNFYVIRIDFKPGDDDVTVYRSPIEITESSNNPALILRNVGDMSFNGISLGAYVNNRTIKHDEIRLGLTWNDILGNSTALLQLQEYSSDSSHLQIVASPNSSLQIQAAPALTGPWTNMAEIIAPALGSQAILDTNSVDSQRFYRALVAPIISPAKSEGIILADFEDSTYGNWVATGTAFGPGPAQGTLANQMAVSGYEGSRLVNSFFGGDSTIGTLTSPEFRISSPFINFLIGGGNHPGLTCINLRITGNLVRTATGSDSEVLHPMQWDVTDYIGQLATVEIVDQATGGWGHISIDQIEMTKTAFPQLTREILLTNSLLNFPVKNGSAMRRVTVTVDGKAARDFDIELADGKPDWWAAIDISHFFGKPATISVNGLNPGSTGLSSIVQTNSIVDATNLYSETLRPQLHFPAKRGWLNDANALVYYQGEYHLYYQHNPYGWNWGNMHWGHAVSPDLVHWKELPAGIYPHSYGDMVYSGSGIIDWPNASGFRNSTNDVIVAAYTSTGRGECIAYSNDRGRTFVDAPENPVIVHSGRDPHLLWYAPSKHWVMALYDEAGGQNISFYSSTNLRNWTYRSRIYGFFECPDLFELPVQGTSTTKWVLNDASSGYMIGNFNGAVFTPETAKLPGNSGSAFYASQTYTEMPTGDARKIRIGWAQISIPGMPFNEMMYFPTELALRSTSTGLRLCTQPVSEITNLFVNEYSWTNLTLNPGANPLSGIRGSLFYLKTRFTPTGTQEIRFSFQNETVSYNTSNQTISFNGKSAPLPTINGEVQLEMIVDRNSIEIFGNTGQLYMPMPASNPESTSLVSLSCSDSSVLFNSLSVCKLKSAWQE